MVVGLTSALQVSTVRLKEVNEVAHHMANQRQTHSSRVHKLQYHKQKTILTKKDLAMSNLTKLLHKSPLARGWSKFPISLSFLVQSGFRKQMEAL